MLMKKNYFAGLKDIKISKINALPFMFAKFNSREFSLDFPFSKFNSAEI